MSEEHNGYEEGSFDSPSNYRAQPRAVGPEADDAEFEDVDMDGDDELVQTGQEDVLGSSLIILPEGATKPIAIKLLSNSIPRNEYQLPAFFYRSDMLPHHLNSMSQDDADNAVVQLDYREGYPTFGNGKIFWNQLPHEPLQSFLLFQRYLEQAETLGLRQLQILSMENNMSLDQCFDMSLEFYWADRARAYDYFIVAADQKKRIARQRKTETKHFDMAENLISKLMEKFEDEDWVSKLDEKQAIECLFHMAKLQRISAGLAANGNTTNQQGNIDPLAAASGEDMMRKVTASLSQENQQQGLTPVLEQLMMDPRFAFQAQALVLQVRQGTQAAEMPQHNGQAANSAIDED